MTYARIEKVAGEIRKANPELTYEQSIVKAAEQRPDLVRGYHEEMRGGGSPESSAASDLSPFKRHLAKNAYQRITKAGAQIQKKDPSLTQEQAFVKVVELNPDLKRQLDEGRGTV